MLIVNIGIMDTES